MAATASSKQHVDALNDATQHARLDAGHLDATTAVPIGGGEHARASSGTQNWRSAFTFVAAVMLSSGERSDRDDRLREHAWADP